MESGKVILCTGGIGCGKSGIMKAFAAMGVPSFDTDNCAKRLYDEDLDILESIADVAGRDVVVSGRLDRKALARRIFSDPSLLERVESIVHPAVIDRFRKWQRGCGSRVVVIESAVMLQKPALMDIPDYVLYVTAPRDVRIRRVMERDGVTEEEVLRRMDCQEDLSSRADCVIETNDRQMILPVLTDIMEKLKNGKDRS